MSNTYEFGLVHFDGGDLSRLTAAGSKGWEAVGIVQSSPSSFTVLVERKTEDKLIVKSSNGTVDASEQYGSPHEVDPVC